MRLSTTLLVLSAAGLAFAQCAICPKDVTKGKILFGLVLDDYDSSSNTTFCGYKEKSKQKPKKEGYCSYNATGTLISDDLKCKTPVGTKKCKKGE